MFSLPPSGDRGVLTGSAEVSLMQGTYLMNGYSVFNVHVGINPTLTYRTVLAQKRNTHFEKNKKIFSEEQKKPADRSQRASIHPYIHFITQKWAKK